MTEFEFAKLIVCGIFIILIVVPILLTMKR